MASMSFALKLKQQMVSEYSFLEYINLAEYSKVVQTCATVMEAARIR